MCVEHRGHCNEVTKQWVSGDKSDKRSGESGKSFPMLLTCEYQAYLIDNGNLFALAEACKIEEKAMPNKLILLPLPNCDRYYLNTTAEKQGLCRNLSAM